MGFDDLKSISDTDVKVSVLDNYAVTDTTDNLQPLLPTNDLLSHKFLASPGHENITRGFIQDLLDIEISDLVVTTPYDIKSYKDGLRQGLRHTVVDVLAQVADGLQVVVEIQVGHLKGFDKRALFGVAARYVANLDHKLDIIQSVDIATKQNFQNEAKYIALSPVYGINVLAENYFSGDSDAYRTFVLYDKEHDSHYGVDGTDLIRLAFLEISKKVNTANINVVYWKQFFSGEKIDDAAPDYIKEAATIVARQNLSAEEAAMITAEQLYQMDIEARIDYGYDRGLEQGMERGLEQGLEQGEIRAKSITAQNLLALGVPIETIQQATGLSAQEIEQL